MWAAVLKQKDDAAPSELAQLEARVNQRFDKLEEMLLQLQAGMGGPPPPPDSNAADAAAEEADDALDDDDAGDDEGAF